MKKIQKTNAARLLDQAKIPYELVSYAVDENDLSAGHVAETMGQVPEQVFKTIVLRGERVGHFVCVVPALTEIDLKVAARAIGDKKVEPIAMKELLPLTGYIRGGCTAIAMKRPLPVLVDASAASLDKMFVSAGQRGLQLHLASSDYITFTGATLVEGLGSTEIINVRK